MSYEGLIFICLLFTVYGLPFTVYGLLFTVYGLLFTVYGLLFTVYGLPFTVGRTNGHCNDLLFSPPGGAIGALNLFKRGVLLAATLKVGILEELYEGESHGMHEGTDHAEGEGNTMSGQQDEDHR